jgi:hypothetical protein
MKKIIYKPRIGAPFKESDADEIGKFIYSVDKRTPENLLNAIKNNPDTVIHKYIEWDDKKASNEYRLQQIREIVNHIEVVVSVCGEQKPIRAFYSVSVPESNKPQYVDYSTVFSTELLRSQVIDRALNELTNWRNRYQTYKELEKIINAIDPFLGGKK